MSHSPGTPSSVWRPCGTSCIGVPRARSRTVADSKTSPASASAAMAEQRSRPRRRAARHAPADRAPASASRSAIAQATALAGRSKTLRKPSPSVLTSRPPCAAKQLAHGRFPSWTMSVNKHRHDGGRCVWSCGGRCGRVAGERGGDALAAFEVELAKGRGDVRFDGPAGDEELLGDLGVAHPLGGELGHAQLARRQCVDAGAHEAARARAGGDELLARGLDERLRAARMRQLHRARQRLPRVGAVPGAAQGRAEPEQRARVLDGHRGPFKAIARCAQ